MKVLMCLAFGCVYFVAACAVCSGQEVTKPSPDSPFARGLREFQSGQFASAAQDFQEATTAKPSDAFAEFYLGQALYEQQKYVDSAIPYERALKLDNAAGKFSEDQRRVATDRLAASYIMRGELKKLHVLLDTAIHRDPQYPLNYYNLACVFAEEDNKGRMLANLSLALQHKDHVLRGTHLPDPRRDDLLRKYLVDDDFIKLIRANGLEEGTDPEDE